LTPSKPFYHLVKTEPSLSSKLLEIPTPISNPERTVRISALAPVSKQGARAMNAIPILKTWLNGEGEFSHVSAIGHVLMIDPTNADELLPVLLKALESDDFGIRCQAAWLLGELGELAEEAVPKLKRMLDDDDSCIRRVASEALQEIMGEKTDGAVSDQSR
jgi:hypothetical protein